MQNSDEEDLTSEDDTFRKLRQIPFREMRQIHILKYTGATREQFTEFLKSYHWTPEEYLISVAGKVLVD